MSPALAALVAADEVIERPASVARELVANAIDAGATSIHVELEQGGLRILRCTDTGCGMDADDARLALERHATSKLRDAADLERITTLGFRGEGLASIVTVAELTLETQQADAPHGVRIEAAFGAMGSTTPCVRVPGTTVTVRHLFRRVPARLKFLGSPASEASKVLKVVREAALAHPAITFRLTNDDQPLLWAPATTDLTERISHVYGAAFVDTLVPIAASRQGVTVTGFVSRPDAANRQPRRSALFLNRRPIVSPEVRRVVWQAMRGRLVTGTYPKYLVFVAMAPDQYDVNVSPDKSQVRFRSPGLVYATVTDAVSASLANARLLASPDPDTGFGATSAHLGLGPPRDAWIHPGWAPHDATRVNAPAHDGPGRTEPSALHRAGAADENASVSMLLDPASSADVSSGHLSLPPCPPILVQMARTFIVAPTEDGVWVLDQHSVAERLIYETLLSRIGAPEQQILLIPENLDVSNPDLRLALVDGLPFLTELGFALEPSGPTSYWVQAVPTWLGDARPADILAGVLATLAEPGARHRRMPLEAVVRERFYKTVACHTAIRAGQVLSDTEMRTLWERLRGIDLALADVHGRAGAVFISHGEIARRLGRSGLPGGR